MNWEMLAAIGQLAAVLYLAIQIRAQTRERRLSAVFALATQWSDLTKSLHESAEFGEIYLHGLQDFEALDPVAKLRFSAFFNRFLKNFQGMYFAHRDGILTGDSWEEIERTMCDLLSYPGTRSWWKTRRHWHGEEFARVVDAIMARGETPKAYATYDLSQLMPKTGEPLSE